MATDRIIRVQLQKAFMVVDEEIKNIDNVLSCQKTSKILRDLANRVEQLSSSQKVNLKESPLAKFDDLIEHLSYKIVRDIEPKIDNIRGIVKEIENSHIKIANQQASVVSTYEQQSDQLSAGQLCRSTALAPSAAQMMEWLSDLEQDVFYLLVEKRHLVNQLDFRSEESHQKLQKMWPSNHGIDKKLTNMMTHLHFFMEEKL